MLTKVLSIGDDEAPPPFEFLPQWHGSIRSAGRRQHDPIRDPILEFPRDQLAEQARRFLAVEPEPEDIGVLSEKFFEIIEL